MIRRVRGALLLLSGLAGLSPAFAQTTVSLRQGVAGYAHAPERP